MKKVRFSRLLILLAGIIGCSRADQQAQETGAVGTPKAAAPAGSWTYHAKDYNFSLDLPSSGWKQMTKKRFIADFWCPARTGSPMLAGVSVVKKQTREHFQASIPQFKANVAKDGDYLLKPTFQEGQTASGNPYVFAALCEKGDADRQFIYVATATVWLADKGITITTLFEGQGQMRSEVFKAIEYADFEAAAKFICLSPR